VSTLDLYVADRDQRLAFTPTAVVICGYTGRDRAAAERHIEELAAIGVARPSKVPDLNVLEGSLVTLAETIPASGPHTSGEAEPVLLFTGGEWYLTVGSDHTDRDLETVDMAASKRACEKPISATVYSSTWAIERGDALVLESFADGSDEPMQRESIAYFRARDELIELIAEKVDGDLEGVVAFCGTVPLRSGGFVFADEYEVALCDPGSEERIAKRYGVTYGGSVPSAVARPMEMNGGADAQR
jgi:hypothetical protein